MKRCASCGHPEVDHEGLSCRSPEVTFGGRCGCRGFEDPDEPEALQTLAPVDEYIRQLDELSMSLFGWRLDRGPKGVYVVP